MRTTQSNYQGGQTKRRRGPWVAPGHALQDGNGEDHPMDSGFLRLVNGLTQFEHVIMWVKQSETTHFREWLYMLILFMIIDGDLIILM